MPLRDWQSWQIGLMWMIGIAVLWIILRRITSSFSGTSATGPGGLSAVSLPMVPLLLAVLVLVGLIAVTIRWMRRSG